MPNNQMPHNLDAEAALLGCLILDEEVQTDILESLREEEFYQESHRLILRAMKSISAAHKTVDTVTLTDQLTRDGTLERAGGLQTVTELSENLPSVANYKQYLAIVRRDAVNRSLIRASRDIAENSLRAPEERTAIDFAEKKIFEISQKEDGTTLANLSDGAVLTQILDKFEEIDKDPSAFRGLETGFTRLDQITHGLQKGSLVIIAARPGMGKTSLAMNIVEHACLRKGKVAAVFSLEMPRTEITQRLLCAYAETSMEKALSGKLGQREWKNLYLASDKLRESKVYIDDSSSIKPSEILSKCRRLKAAEGSLDLVMIDYIQLMQSNEKMGGGEYNRQQEIASITRFLKIMAKELDVPVIALSQLRRIQTKEPQLSDLRESGAIEQDADIVMFINRPDVGATPEEFAKGNLVKGAAYLQIAKHRNGKSDCRIQLRFIGETTKFVEVEDQGRPMEEPVYAPKKKPELADPDGAFPDGEDIPFE